MKSKFAIVNCLAIPFHLSTKRKTPSALVETPLRSSFSVHDIVIGERQYKSWGDVSIYEAELFLTDPAGKIGGTWITSSSAYASCFFKETVGGCGIKEKTLQN